MYVLITKYTYLYKEVLSHALHIFDCMQLFYYVLLCTPKKLSLNYPKDAINGNVIYAPIKQFSFYLLNFSREV